MGQMMMAAIWWQEHVVVVEWRRGLIGWVLIGLIAGWLAGHIVRGTGYGLIADICIGIVGALIGSWLLPQLGIHIGGGVISAIIVATIGAVILLLLVRLLGRGMPRRRYWRF